MLNTCHLLVSTVAAAEEDLPLPCYEYNVGILACGLCGVVYLTEKIDFVSFSSEKQRHFEIQYCVNI